MFDVRNLPSPELASLIANNRRDTNPPISGPIDLAYEFSRPAGFLTQEYTHIVIGLKDGTGAAIVDQLQAAGIDAGLCAGYPAVKNSETARRAKEILGLYQYVVAEVSGDAALEMQAKLIERGIDVGLLDGKPAVLDRQSLADARVALGQKKGSEQA